MRFGLICEGDTPEGLTHFHRYHELVDEAVLAEEVGFDFWGTSEQHFHPSVASVSAPETLYSYVAARTKTIKLRLMSIVMLKFNHPIRVAERLATLDILSNGRVEFCTARSNNPGTIDAFQVSASETRGQWREGVELTVRALTEDPVEFNGDYYQFPSRSVTPRLYRPMFPVSMAASSRETFTMAGEFGLGVIMTDNYAGWEYVEECAKLYRKAAADPTPFAAYPASESLGFVVMTTACDEDPQRAKRNAAHVAQGVLVVCHQMYTALAKRDQSYADLARIETLYQKREDLDFMMDASPTVLAGGPDRFIETIRRLEALGYDEVIFRVDGLGYEENMRTIEMIGKYVIPTLRMPSAAVTPSQYVTDMKLESVPQYLI
ncbi:LLM class flavin-dependent oxidoreductase [Mycolicibacterium sp. XJ1819]